MDKKRLYCFDFDGTLTSHDTLLAFIAYVHGGFKLFMTLLRFSPQLVAMKLRLYPNWVVKQRVFSHLFRGMSLEEFNRHCRDFAASDGHLIRPRARTSLHSLLAGGNRVVVISASVENWVRPFSRRWTMERTLFSCVRKWKQGMACSQGVSLPPTAMAPRKSIACGRYCPLPVSDTLLLPMATAVATGNC